MKNINSLNLVIVITIFLVIACTCPKADENKPTNSTATAPAKDSSSETTTGTPLRNETKPAETGGVTMANFNKIKNGMRYEEVVKILGKEGEVLSETEAGGYKTVMYKWDGEGFSNLNAMFQNGKLISKAQFGLK